MMRRLSATLCILMLAASSAFAEDEKSDAGASSVLVAVAAPVQGTLAQPVTAYGLIQPAAGGSMAVSSLHAAQVLRLRVVAGQVVEKGEALLDLSADPAAALASAQAASDLKLAQAELARTRQMLAEKLATGSQLDQAAKAVTDAEATLKARQREGGIASVETVKASIAGVVMTVAIANGDHVQPGATLLDLAGADSLSGVLGVGPEDRVRVKVGQIVHIVDLDAPAAASAAKIGSVGGMADPKTGLFTVVVTPAENNEAPLIPGGHVRATIETDGIAGWIVPRDAVLTDEDGPFLFQIADGKAARVAVEILGESAKKIAVSGPIDPKKKMVISGNYQLADGTAVREQAVTDEPPETPRAEKPAEAGKAK